jgi:hypothetical protein
MLIRRKRKNIRVASRIQFCGGRPSAPEKGNIRRETLVLPCATYPETARPEAPLSKIFGDQIERVRFARTLRWREVDSNFRFLVARPSNRHARRDYCLENGSRSVAEPKVRIQISSPASHPRGGFRGIDAMVERLRSPAPSADAAERPALRSLVTFRRKNSRPKSLI